MIKCIDITKTYGRNVVIDSFSYTFGDTGFYLLFGESGSGKTTFINILSGMIPFDSGRVVINGREFSENVDMDSASAVCDYITQDTFFVNFLTVADNLRLIKSDAEKINEVLSRVGLDGKGTQYPETLSGGERQRLAIARAMLSDKKILFLDEPTASLDAENKRAVFSLLADISKSCLVICSSHDIEAKSYADHVIEFTKSRGASTAPVPKPRRRKKRAAVKRRPTAELYPFMKKWSSSRSRARRPDVLFGIFLTLAMCLLMLADTPMRKLDANAAGLYRINVMEVRAEGGEKSDYELLCGLDGVREVLPRYGSVLPELTEDYDPETGEFTLPPVDYELTEQYTLPGSADIFPFSDRIEYGTYYTDEKQVIISDAYARYLSPDDPGKTVGLTINKNLYGIGEVDLTVVGVLSPIDNFEFRYFQVQTGGTADLFVDYDGTVSETRPHDNEIYINGDIFDEYKKDEYFIGGQRCRYYFLYFDGYREMKEFIAENCDLLKDYGIYCQPFADEEFVLPVFEALSCILLPLSALITLLSVVFYACIVKTELAYNNSFVSVFNYAGFTIGQVTCVLARLNVQKLLMICTISGAMAAAVSVAVNALNRHFVFVNFEIFTYNIPLLLSAAAVIVCSSFLAVNFFLRRLKYRSWYENLIAGRDLL